MSSLLFKDIGKSQKDLLTKDFPSDKKVEVNSKPRNDLSVKFTGTFRDDNGINAVVEPKLNISKYNTEITGTVTNSDKLAVETVIKPAKVKGLKVTLNGENSKGGQTLKGSIEYKADKANVTVDATVPSNKQTVLSVSTAVKKDRIAAGACIVYGINQEPALKSYDAAVQFQEKDFTASVYANGAKDNLAVGATYYHSLNWRNGAVAGNFKYNVNDSKTPVSLTVGGQATLDDKSVVKARLDSNARLGLSYQHTLSSNAKFTAGAEVNATNLNDGANNKFGLHFVIDH